MSAGACPHDCPDTCGVITDVEDDSLPRICLPEDCEHFLLRLLAKSASDRFQSLNDVFEALIILEAWRQA